MIEKLMLWGIKMQGRKPVRKVLAGALPGKEIRNLYATAWKHFKVRKIHLEKEPTLGATLTVKLSLLTHILYEQMLEHGLDNQTSLVFSRKITWTLYRSYAMMAWKISRWFRRDRVSRLRWMMHIFWKCFPYNAPGYDMRVRSSPPDHFVFHVHRCPASEYFRSHLLPDLCIETWCNLDYGLAEEWDLNLERTDTLSAGAPYCDFVFKKE